MNLSHFENLVLSYLNTKNEETFIDVLTALKPYMITVINNTYLVNYNYDDIMQELQLTVFTALSKYIPSFKAWGYLTTSIKNKVYELYSIDKKITLTDLTMLQYSYTNSFSTLDINILNEYITPNISPIELTILNLYYVNDYSINQISVTLKKSSSFISKKKCSALKKLGCSF